MIFFLITLVGIERTILCYH